MYADTVKQFDIEHGLTEGDGVNFSAEITHQLVGHLNDLEIKTHGSKEMEEDLRRREEEEQRDELSSTIDKARLGDGHIESGYTLDDVAVIEKINEDGSWEVVHENTDDNNTQYAFTGSQLTFAHGIRKPQGADLMLLSSAIMTQSNTFGKLTSELADKSDGTVVKKVILYGNHAYLWSTENGYDFFIEQKITINEKNHQAINDLLETYGTDEFTADAINSIQRSEDKKTGSRSLADFAKRERSGKNSGPIGRNSRRLSEISNGTGTNEHNLSDTQGKTNFITQQGQVYGYATPKGAIYLDERVIKKSRT